MVSAITALPCCNFSFGKTSGSTPDIAGHQRAFKTPKSAPINAKSRTLELLTISEIALIAANPLPITSAPPTIRLRLNRSPTTPPNNIKAIIGNIRAAITMLRSFAVAPGRAKTPKASATGEMPFPTFEIKREVARAVNPGCEWRSCSSRRIWQA